MYPAAYSPAEFCDFANIGMEVIVGNELNIVINTMISWLRLGTSESTLKNAIGKSNTAVDFSTF